MSYIDSGTISARLQRPLPRSQPPRHRNMLAWCALGLLLAQGLAHCVVAHRRHAAERDAASALARWEGLGGEHEPPVGGGIME